MEKLEKALSKARKLRAHKERETGATRDLSNEMRTLPVFASAQDLTSLPAATVSIDESVLEAHRIVANQTLSKEADIFRLLRAQVLKEMQQNSYQTVAITSPRYGDGKTTLAINLALSIALDVKQTVLLVDLDLRKPSIASYMGIPPHLPGLTEYLAGDCDLSACLQRMPYERLVVLPAGNRTEHSSEVLGLPQMRQLAKEMKERYRDRLIIYDMPPLLTQDDPLTFMPYIDASLLVLRSGVTSKDDIKRSLDITSGYHMIGTVLNCPSLS